MHRVRGGSSRHRSSRVCGAPRDDPRAPGSRSTDQRVRDLDDVHWSGSVAATVRLLVGTRVDRHRDLVYPGVRTASHVTRTHGYASSASARLPRPPSGPVRLVCPGTGPTGRGTASGHEIVRDVRPHRLPVRSSGQPGHGLPRTFSSDHEVVEADVAASATCRPSRRTISRDRVAARGQRPGDRRSRARRTTPAGICPVPGDRDDDM